MRCMLSICGGAILIESTYYYPQLSVGERKVLEAQSYMGYRVECLA